MILSLLNCLRRLSLSKRKELYIESSRCYFDGPCIVSGVFSTSGHQLTRENLL